jgi:hypothetical protein
VSLLKSAVAARRWDLAATAIIYALAQTLDNGEKPDARKETNQKEELSGCCSAE